MIRLLGYLLALLIVAGAAGVVYALIADLPPPTRAIEVDVAPASGA